MPLLYTNECSWSYKSCSTLLQLFSTANTVQDLLKSLISNPENCLQINFPPDSAVVSPPFEHGVRS